MTALDFKIKIWDKDAAEVIKRNVPRSWLMHVLMTMLLVCQKVARIGDLVLMMLAHVMWSRSPDHIVSYTARVLALLFLCKKFPFQISLA